MERSIVMVPRVLMLAATCDWDIDWGGQSAGEDTARGDQVVYSRMPRFVGNPRILLPRKTIGAWRALRWQAKGRVNAWSIPMIDDVSCDVQTGTWESDWQAWQADQYVEPRPTVICTEAVVAGATKISVDETSAEQPIRVGAILSFDDWPFVVTGRSGAAADVTLQVSRLATDIGEGDQIDLYARGLFIAADDAMGNPAYGLPRSTSVDLAFKEWITRT